MNWQPSRFAASMRPRVRQAVQLFCTAIGVSFICLPAWSQSNTGRILGTLTDHNPNVTLPVHDYGLAMNSFIALLNLINVNLAGRGTFRRHGHKQAPQLRGQKARLSAGA